MQRLKQRRDFRVAAREQKVHARAWVLQWRCRDDRDPARIGFTVTKKTASKAVERNRIRRRLKAVVRRLGPEAAGPGMDLVMLARRAALTEPFGRMVDDLDRALATIRSKAPTRLGNEAADG